ncbi:hypothetical protein LTR22_021879 [Elasticomyces elasticus]|nr:hypothetical protein LTR22_021879 [Elasticomyces elasticus]
MSNIKRTTRKSTGGYAPRRPLRLKKRQTSPVSFKEMVAKLQDFVDDLQSIPNDEIATHELASTIVALESESIECSDFVVRNLIKDAEVKLEEFEHAKNTKGQEKADEDTSTSTKQTSQAQAVRNIVLKWGNLLQDMYQQVNDNYNDSEDESWTDNRNSD